MSSTSSSSGTIVALPAIPLQEQGYLASNPQEDFDAGAQGGFPEDAPQPGSKPVLTQQSSDLFSDAEDLASPDASSFVDEPISSPNDSHSKFDFEVTSSARRRAVPRPSDGLFSPSSAGELQDVDLAPPGSSQEEPDEALSEDSEPATAMTNWEKIKTMTSAAASPNVTTSSEINMSWLSDSFKSMKGTWNSTSASKSLGGLFAAAPSGPVASQITNTLKKWGDEITATATELLQEETTRTAKDAFVANFGRQVSRRAAEEDDCYFNDYYTASKYDHYPNVI